MDQMSLQTKKQTNKQTKKQTKATRNEMFHHQGGDECCSTENQCGAGEVPKIFNFG